MANREYPESEMRFVFDEDRVFLLEQQPFFVSMQDVRACDFISLQKRKTESTLLFIEAKSSAPKLAESLDQYLHEVYEKFWHSLLLYIAILFNRLRESPKGIPRDMGNKNNIKRKIVCVLVAYAGQTPCLGCAA